MTVNGVSKYPIKRGDLHDQLRFFKEELKEDLARPFQYLFFRNSFLD